MASSALKSGLYPGRFTSCSFRFGVRRYSRIASPRWAGALSQITFKDPGCFSFSCFRKATEVPELLLPPSSIHSTPAFARAGSPPSPSIPLSSSWPSPRSWDWWTPPEPALVETGGRFSLLHPLPPQLRVRPEVGLVSEEYPSPGPLGLLPHSSILRHEGCPLLLIRLQQPFLGPLESKSQPVQPVQATAAAQAGAKAFQDKLPYRLPIPVGQFQARRRWRLLHRRLQLLLFRLVKGGGEPPVCSKINALEPPSPKADAHRPMV